MPRLFASLLLVLLAPLQLGAQGPGGHIRLLRAVAVLVSHLVRT